MEFKLTIMTTETKAAAQHFIDLYNEEIKAGEVSEDTIFEWWTMTKDQYPDAEYEQVERLILKRMEDATNA